MANSPLVEQEFVAHLFAPLTGPHADKAIDQLRQLWSNCREELGMTMAIADADLSGRWPSDIRSQPDGALAGIQDRTVDYQAIVRREHDLLNVSLVMATPLAAPHHRRGISRSMPPTWQEFTRWWRLLTARISAESLLGSATIYQAKAARPANADVRTALPGGEEDVVAWWTRPTTVDDFTAWEVTPAGSQAARRFVVVARPGEDARLSRFTWSAGDTALPPLGRYLMHAAKLRYQARVRGDGRDLVELRERVDDLLDRATEQLRNPTGTAGRTDRTALAADEAELAAVLQRLRMMLRTVDVARDNMGRALTDPFPADALLGERLAELLRDDIEYLDATYERAARLRQTTTSGAGQIVPDGPGQDAASRHSLIPSAPRSAGTGAGPPPPVADPAEPSATTVRTDGVEFRILLGIDVVGTSGWSFRELWQVESRMAALVDQVLDRIGLRVYDTDRQPLGDGGIVMVLPPGLEPPRVVAGLLNGWRAALADDNAAHPGQRIRIRMWVASGLVAAASIGLRGRIVTESARLLGGMLLRHAAAHRPDADVVAIVSDPLHRAVAEHGYSGLDPRDFASLPVGANDELVPAWLWTGGTAAPAATTTPAATTAAGSTGGRPARDPRNVFVVHGRDGQAQAAICDLLRDLDLHPLDWEEIVGRTGEPTPFLGEVLEQAFVDNQAAVVVITPDDAVLLHPELRQQDEDHHERMVMGQSRPNVLFEAGMALGLQRDRTLVVEIGRTRPFADLGGRNVIRFTSDHGRHLASVHKIAQRLRIAGCPVDIDGTRWRDTTRFRNLDAYTRRFALDWGDQP